MSDCRYGVSPVNYPDPDPEDPSFLHADSEDSDQTGRMPRLIWVFAGRTCHFVGFVTRRLIWRRERKIEKTWKKRPIHTAPAASTVNPNMPGGLFHPYQLDESISKFRGVWCTFIHVEILQANSVDSDQTPRPVASDLGLHCLPRSQTWDAGHKRVNWAPGITKLYDNRHRLFSRRFSYRCIGR